MFKWEEKWRQMHDKHEPSIRMFELWDESNLHNWGTGSCWRVWCKREPVPPVPPRTFLCIVCTLRPTELWKWRQVVKVVMVHRTSGSGPLKAKTSQEELPMPDTYITHWVATPTEWNTRPKGARGVRCCRYAPSWGTGYGTEIEECVYLSYLLWNTNSLHLHSPQIITLLIVIYFLVDLNFQDRHSLHVGHVPKSQSHICPPPLPPSL